jgi:DNA-binding GntR family transcriptional regulator
MSRQPVYGGDRGPVAPLTRTDAVAAELRRLIHSGELPPGTHLRQTEIARRFGVSTTPVREAFASLAREGLVRQDAHRGVVVFEPSLEELRENYEIRGALEGLATELAAPRLHVQDLEDLRALVDQMRRVGDEGFPTLNHTFHTRIYAATGRPRLAEMIESLREVAASYLAMTVRTTDSRYRTAVQDEHDQILVALRARDAKRAGRLMRAHLRHNQRQLAALIERERPGAPAAVDVSAA